MSPQERVRHERELRRAVLAGDASAWRALYDGAFAGLAAYAAWRCAGMRDLADDVVQETWLTAVRRLRDFDPAAGSFLGWLRGIAANVLRNQLRHRRDHEPLTNADGALQPTDANEQAEPIVQALASLPDRYEAVLRAKYLDQLGVSAIAATWGESPKAVESLLSRARAAFRDAYLSREGADPVYRETES